MIVFSDPSFCESYPELLKTLRKTLTEARESDRLDAYRSLVIRAGQLEQGLADAHAPKRLLKRAEQLTDRAADAFVSRWALSQEKVGATFPDREENLEDLVQAVGRIHARDFSLQIKVPEGFAFYSLFPESFADAALRWLETAKPQTDEKILVIGVRSIGTTLSAIVHSILSAMGYEVERTTVRPAGDPFDRVTSFEGLDVGTFRWCLVVDEGPGLSGSSMSSVAEAVSNAGLREEKVVFLTGHSGLPGNQTGERSRYWWNSVSRYSTSFDSLKWHGNSLNEQFVEQSSVYFQADIESVQDLSGGKWRAFAFKHEEAWPAARGIFERTKARVVTKDGRSLLWRFEGFAQRKRGKTTQTPWTEGAVADWHGFSAFEWKNGDRLTSSDATEDVVKQIGSYILAAAAPPLDEAGAKSAKDRLALLLAQNIYEALGTRAAKAACSMIDFVNFELDCPSSGDGRMAPYEWVRLANGKLFKTDSLSHELDHTIVGQQPICWDVAGAIVEWGLNESQVKTLLNKVTSCQFCSDENELAFYVVAYSAFRMAQCAFLKSQCGDDLAEAARQEGAELRYRRRICDTLMY